MKSIAAHGTGDDASYGISAVSRLTGVSAPNLRVWEKRYGLVSPERSGSRRRLYSGQDIRRLTLLKSLVDRGHSIGSIASLETPELERRLHEFAFDPGAASRPAGPCRLIVIGPELGSLLGRDDSLEGTRVVARWESLEAARRVVDPPRADLVLVDCPTLFPETVGEVRQYVRGTSALRAVAVYRFAHGKTTRMVDKDLEAITAIRGPVDLNELRLACQAEIALMRLSVDRSGSEPAADPAARDQTPPRLFSESDLARIAGLSSSVECECPQHLASLLGSLTAFEQYSFECEDRSPEDAAIHAALHRATARARHTMEQALRDLIVAEGYDLP